MKIAKLLSALILVVVILGGCNQHLDRVVVTAPEIGTVVTLTNGSSITLRRVKIRVLNAAGYEEPWRDVPDLSNGAHIPVDLAGAILNAHRPNVPPGIDFTVQMSQDQQAPQLRSWSFKEGSGPGGVTRLVAFEPPVETVRN